MSWGARAIAAIALIVGLVLPAAASAAPVKNGRIAFDALGAGRSDIASIERDGTGWTDLTPGDHVPYCSPSWSPDGTKIAFVAPHPVLPGGVQKTSGDLFVMNADGSDAHALALAEPAQLCYATTWSADGAWIAYVRGNFAQIYAVRSNGLGAPLKVTDDELPYRNPSWSNDGSRIAYDGQGHLYTTAVTPVGPTLLFGAKHQVDPSAAIGVKPDWSADDARVVVETDGAGASRGLYTFDSTDGSDVTQVTFGSTTADGKWTDTDSSWSPDGKRIAFVRTFYDANGGSTGRQGIYSIAVDGSREPVLITEPSNGFPFLGQPAWQPLPRP